MTGFSAIDLKALPAPQIINAVSYDARLEALIDHVATAHPEFEKALKLESEPMHQVLRAAAAFMVHDQADFNDRAQGAFLALAVGADLDQLGAFWGVERLIVQAADDEAIPPIPEIKESDDAFRARINLSLDGHSTAGARESYRYWALTADADVIDVHVPLEPETPPYVVVTVLTGKNDGVATQAVLDAVKATLNAEHRRPLCSQITVQAATPVAYQIKADLILEDGPANPLVLSAAETAITAFVEKQRGLGRDITISAIHAALNVEGVHNVIITSPAADVEIAPHEFAQASADPVIGIGGQNV